MVSNDTALFRARVPARRLKKVGRILGRAGLTTGEAVNVFLAQVEINNGLPFPVRAAPAQAEAGDGLLRSTEQTMQFWNEMFDDEFSR
jgi:antitoxin component of RelBE/YafQ-DinJ toxin-antitoxin module